MTAPTGVPMLSTGDARAAVGGVVDPCSRFNGFELTLEELGMVRSVEVRGGRVDVELLLDDPTCIFYFDISRQIEQRLGQLTGVEEIEVTSASDELWTEERMDPGALERLTTHRAELRERLGITRPLLPTAPRPSPAG